MRLIYDGMGHERWKRRPTGSNWGDFGPDDQLGRINLLTPERRKLAASEVREGLAFCLSLPLDQPSERVMAPYRHALILRPGLAGGAPNFNWLWSQAEPGSTDVVNDDVVVMYLQGSTQWDSLCHVGSLFDADDDGEPELVYYNGFRAGEHISASGDPADAGMWSASTSSTTRVDALGIGGMALAGVQGRGVLVDLAAHAGAARVGYAGLMSALAAEDVIVEEGDMLCLHTGFAQALLDAGYEADVPALMASTPALDGRDPRLQAWIAESGIATLSADNFAVEAIPAAPAPKPSAALPLHELCLFKLGIHLGEMWNLAPLAQWLRENGRSRFLLTAPPLRIPGAVGSPANGIATV
jgi:kynurenine formamidase